MNAMMRKVLVLVAGLAGLAGVMRGQAVATATGPGSNVSVGFGYSGFQADYGHRNIMGTYTYVDVNPQWRFGLEGEARFLHHHTFQDVTEADLLGGVRVAVLRPGRWNPYGKFLAGVGRITLPYGYAHGSFLAYAPGAGVDLAVNDRITVRAVDLEYQHWPQFPYGALSPYGVSAGVSVRLNAVRRYPR